MFANEISNGPHKSAGGDQRLTFQSMLSATLGHFEQEIPKLKLKKLGLMFALASTIVLKILPDQPGRFSNPPASRRFSTT